MKKFYAWIVGHRRFVLAAFGILFVLCFFLKNLVSVNYDINDYLPEATHSNVSLEVMEQEFSGGIPNARVMIHDVTIPEALEYKEKLSAEHREVLDKLSQKYKLLMVGAGQVMRIFNQLEQFPIDIIGNYNMQYGVYNAETKNIDIVTDVSVGCDRQQIPFVITVCS